MAEPDQIAIFQELHNRNAVPEQYKPVVGELVRRGVIKSKAQPEQVDAPEGFPRYARQFRNALIPGGDILGAAVSTVNDKLRGTDQGWGDRFNTNLTDEWKRSEAADRTAGTGDYIAKGLGMAGGMAALLPLAGGNALFQGARAIPTTGDLMRVGAGWGGLQAALGGTSETLSGRIGDTAAGMVGGAVLGPVFQKAVEATDTATRYAGDTLRRLTNRTPQQQQDFEKAVRDWHNAGVRPLGPAITDSRAQAATAEGITNSVLGGRLRRAAEESTSDVQNNVRNVLARYTNGRTISDQGASIQQDLENALIRYSRPNSEIAGMNNAELERITGPVGPAGFDVPRPTVRPVEPQYPQPVKPRFVDPASIEVDPVAPRTVTRPEANPTRTPLEEYPFQADHVKRFDDAMAVWRNKDDIVASKRRAFEAEAKANGMSADQYWQHIHEPWSGLSGLDRPPLSQVARDYKAAVNERNAASRAVEGVRSEAETARETAWRRAMQQEDIRASAEADAIYRSERAKAQAEAEAATGKVREQKLAEERARADAEAAAENERARLEADRYAARETERAQAAATESWERERQNRPGFQPGRSQESYPTEFSAAYQRVENEAPRIQRNILGGGGPSGSATPTATESLLNSLALEARQKGLLKGYKKGDLFDAETGAIHPEFMAYLKDRVSPDIAERIASYAAYRQKGQLAPGYEGLRDFRTTARRGAEEAEFPRWPAQPRKEEAATMRRIEGAAGEDLGSFLRSAGERGQRAAAMYENIDAGYRDYIKNLRAPLSKLFGEKVTPVDAMDKLSRAARDGDLPMLRAFMRVMHEKADPSRGAAAIMTTMMNDNPSLPSFLKAMCELPPESRNVIFGQSRAMRMQLEQLEKIATRLEPYQRGIAEGGRIDLSSKTNLFLGMTMLGHMYATLGMVGGVTLTSRFMASPRYLRWMTEAAKASSAPQWKSMLAQLTTLANADKSDLGKEVVRTVATLGGTLKPNDARAQDMDAHRGIFTSLEQPPSVDEAKAAMRNGVRIFDFDLNQGDTAKTVSEIKRNGGKITAYHVGGGGGRAWGGKAEGEEVRKYDKPEDFEALKADVQDLVKKGADYIHFDNTHRLSGRRLEQIAATIKEAGAGYVAKNNPEKWNLVMKRRPDLKPAYAVIENAMHDGDETQEAYHLHEKGVPVFIVGFRKPMDGEPVTDEYAAEYRKANPWAKVLLMDDESSYEGRGTK